MQYGGKSARTRVIAAVIQIVKYRTFITTKYVVKTCQSPHLAPRGEVCEMTTGLGRVIWKQKFMCASSCMLLIMSVADHVA